MNITVGRDEFGDLIVTATAPGFSGTVTDRGDGRVSLLGGLSSNPMPREKLPLLIAALAAFHAASA